MKQNEEPEYVKLYLKDLMYLDGLPTKHYLTLWALMKYATFNENEQCMMVYLNAGLKKEITNNVNLTLRSLQNTLCQLTDGNILIRKDRSCYALNPYFFGLGHWSDIEKARIEIDYDEINGRSFKANLDKKKEGEIEEC